MKIKSVFFLVLFTTFLLSPAATQLCDKEANLSIYFSINEEETSDSLLVVNEDRVSSAWTIPVKLAFLISKSNSVIHDTLLWNTLYLDTSSPPPEA